MVKIIFIVAIYFSLTFSLFPSDILNDVKSLDSSKVVADTSFNLYHYNPFQFLDMLKRFSFPTFTLWKEYKNWIKKEDIPKLIKLLDSKDSCANVSIATSSFLDMKFSTVGQEAAYMILSFQKGIYPPGLNSSIYVWNKNDIIKWWEKNK